MSDKNLPAVIEGAAKSQGLSLSNVNLIMPTETFGAVLGQFDKITIETVRINTADSREVYEPSGKGKGFALGKVPLQSIATALSIQWHPQFTGIVESTARRSRAKAVGLMRKPNGETITQTEEKTIDLDVEEDDLREKAEKDAEGGKIVRWEESASGKSFPVKEPWKNETERSEWIDRKVKDGLKQKRKFKDELAMTGAKDRVIRAFLSLKSTYTKDELSKPLAFPRVTTDTNKMLADPQLRQAAIDMIAPSASRVYGPPEDMPRIALSEAQQESAPEVPPEPRNVTPPADPSAETDADIFGDEEALDPREPFREVLRGYVDDFGDKFKAADLEKIKAAAEDEDIALADLRKKVETVHGYLKSHGLVTDGAA